MSDELKKIIPLLSDPVKKSVKNSESKKKLDSVDKEVFLLTKGLFPLQPSSAWGSDKSKVKSEWVYSPINFNNPKDVPIHHWVQKQDKDKIFAFERFQIPIEIIEFTRAEYDQHLNDLDSSWNFEETEYFWSLCKRFDLRFIIIQDAYDEKYKRTLEDLKKRYYSVCKKILEVRGETKHPLYNYQYDENYEKIRKYQLEKFIMRSKKINDEERDLVEELRKLDQIIKKEEKEQMGLQKILTLNSKESESSGEKNSEEEITFRKINEEKNQMKKKKEKICYLRGQIMNAPLPFSPRIIKKLNLVLGELNIPTKPIPTVENEELFDNLREQIVIMFNLQKHLKKKEMERKQLEDKLNSMKPQEEMMVANFPAHFPMSIQSTASKDIEKRKSQYEIDEKIHGGSSYKKMKN